MGKYINITLYKFGTDVVNEAKRNIGAVRRNRRTDSTGRLRKSISFEPDKGSNSISFIMEDYGAYVDSGRDGEKRKWRGKRGLIQRKNNPKFPPLSAIKKWINDKPIRPRNLKTNQFVKKTPKAINSMAYLIGRKIKREGIKPTYFFSDAVRKYEDQVGKELVESVWKDFEQKI